MNSITRSPSVVRSLAVLAAAACLTFLASCAASKGAPQGGSDGAVVYEEKPIIHEVSSEDRAKAKSKQAIAANTAVLYVNGMGCPLCATNINMQLERVRGVESVHVDLGIGIVTIGMRPGAPHPSPYVLGEAVEDAGFTLVKVEER